MSISKHVLLPLTALVLATPALFSLYNGNPDLPEMPEIGLFIPKNSWAGVKIGYEGDIVFNRGMMVSSTHGDFSNTVSNFQSTSNGGTFTLGFSDRVEVYLMLCANEFKISQKPESGTTVKFQTDNHLGGFIGIRATVAYWGETRLGVDAKYFLSLPNITSIEINGEGVSPGSAKIHDSDWQVGVGVSHRVSFFVPYIGIKYSQILVRLTRLYSLEPLVPNKYRLQNKVPVGVFFGFGLSANRAFALNLEGRIIDDTAATLTADFRF